MTDACDPGWLRHRVAIEAASATTDEAGGAGVTWTTLASVWARIEPATAKEESVADHRATVTTHRITIRWRSDITGGMRIAYRGRIFRVAAVEDPDESRRYLVLKAEEEAP